NPGDIFALKIINNERLGGEPYFGTGKTDWTNAISNDMAARNELHLSYGGASQVTNYYISLGTDLGNGLFKREDFNSYNVKANLDSKPLDRLKISTTLSYNYNEHKSGSIDNFSQAFFFQPTYNIHGPDGSYTTYTSATGDVSYNPVTLNKSVDNKTIGKNFMGSA